MLKIVPTQSSFCPGEEIRGKVLWSDIQADRIEVRLIWYTQGKGTQDSMIVESREVKTVGSNGEYNYQFSTPRRPYSFSGTLISLVWAIEVIIFPQRNAEQHEIVITPNQEEIRLEPVASKDTKSLK